MQGGGNVAMLLPRSLSDLKEIYCKFAWTTHISPLSWSIEQLLTRETSKICPRPAKFCEQPLCGFACLNLFATILQVRQTPGCLMLCCSSQNKRAGINDGKYFAADSCHC